MRANTLQTAVIILLTATGAINICKAQTGSSTTSGQAPDFQVKFSEPLAVSNFSFEDIVW